MFADRNFSTGLLFMAVTGVLLLAGLALLPPLLQNLYGYSVLQSGFLTAPRGVGTLISMLLAGRLVGKIDARLLVGIGVALMGMSLWMMTGFALDQPSTPGDHQRRRPGARARPDLRAAAEPRLRDARAADADHRGGLLNLSRNIGGSVGISVVSAQLVRMTQVAHADIAAHDHRADDPDGRSDAACRRSRRRVSTAFAMINAEVTRQAVFIAYLDDFKLMMLVTFAVLPLLLLMRRAGPSGARPQVATGLIWWTRGGRKLRQ